MTNLVSSACVYNPTTDQFDLQLMNGASEAGSGPDSQGFVEEVSVEIINAVKTLVKDGVEYAGGSVTAQNTLSRMVMVAAITLDAVHDLYQERQLNGEQSMQNKIATIAQSVAGIMVAAIVAEPIIVGSALVGGGIVAELAVGAAVGFLTSEAYNAHFFDDSTKSASDKLGDFVNNFNAAQFKDDLFLVASDGPNLLIETAKNKLDSLVSDAHTIGDFLSDYLHRFTQGEAITPAARHYDPLTLDLNHNGQIDLISLDNSNTFFDITGNGLQNKVGWVADGGTGTADGFLVLDANNNGKVDNVDELFGHGNSDGSETTGTQELSLYDSNSDGKIDANDAIFSDLKIWQDTNGNGETDAGELKTLADFNITAIDLNTTTTNQNVNGNIIISEGSYEYNDDQNNPQTAKITNLDLAIDFTNSRSYSYQDNQGNNISYTLNLETLALPFSRGYGNAKAWHIAMSEDSTLLQMMKDIVNVNNPDLQSDQNNLVTYSNLNSKIEAFIYQWTGTENVTGMRGAFDAKQLAAMEAIRGIIYTDFSGSHDVSFIGTSNASNVTVLQSAWDILIADIASKIFVQGILKSDYPNSYYDFSTDSIVYGGSDKQIDSVIFGTAGNDVGNNTIYGSGYDLNSSPNLITKNDILIGGHGDDLLVGGKGDDIYLYSKGDGHDTIAETQDGAFGNQNFGNDKIIFDATINKDDVYFAANGEGDLVIRFKDNDSDSIALKDVLLGNNPPISNIIEKLQFADGQIIDISDVQNLTQEFHGNNTDEYTYLNSNTHNIVDAGAGDDLIIISENDSNFYSTNNITAGTGNDEIHGSHGSDTYSFNVGDGQDTIYDNEGTDKISFGSGIVQNNIYFTTGEADVYNVVHDLVIKFNNSEDSITIKNYFDNADVRIEALQFNDGSTLDISNPNNLTLSIVGTSDNDIINGKTGNDLIDALDGNDTINAGTGDDIIIGGKGDDTIGTGGNINFGNDTYIFNRGDGKDTIGEVLPGSHDNGIGINAGNDKIILGEGIEQSDVYFTVSSTDYLNGNQHISRQNLVINFHSAPGDQITILKHIDSVSSEIETLQFHDGSTIDLTNFQNLHLTFNGTSGNDEIYGLEGNDVMNGGDGNDYLVGNGGNDILSGGNGDDTLDGNNGNDQLTGNSGDDLLRGGQGDDIYYFNLNNGHDTIAEYSTSTSSDSDFGNDKIVLGAGIAASDLIFSYQINNASHNYDLVINFNNNQNDQITISNQFNGLANRIETIQFNDGSTLDISSSSNIHNATIYGTSGNDNMSSTFTFGDNLNIDSGAGNDVVEDGFGDDVITGGTGDDYINSYYGGNDTFIYNKGDGKDVITESVGNSDKIIFGANVSRDDVYLVREQTNPYYEDVIIKFHSSPNDEIRIANFSYQGSGDSNGKIEILQFSDGTTLDISNPDSIVLGGSSGNDTITTGSGDEVIVAGLGNDIISSGTGSDTITGGAGDDTFIIAANNDNKTTTITDFEFNNHDEKIDLSAFANIHSFNDLTITEGSAIVHLPDGQLIHILDATPSDIIADNFIFAPYEDLNLTGTSSNNILIGDGGNDTLNGGTGSDLLDGGAGNDTLVYSNDQVWSTGFVALNVGSPDAVDWGGEQIVIAPRVGSADAFEGGSGTDTIQMSSANEALFLDDRYTNNPFGNGDGLGTARIHNVEIINAGGGDDIVDLTSDQFSYGNVTLNGDDGNDVLWSSSGNDHINGGNGNDNIDGGTGDDILNGDSGNDTIYGKGGDDQITGGLGQDTMTGGTGADHFNFTSFQDSSISASDIIKDFTQGQDKINLHDLNLVDHFITMDANPNDGIPEGQTGELSYHFDSSNNTIVEYHDNNSNHDLAIKLLGHINLANGDFEF